MTRAARNSSSLSRSTSTSLIVGIKSGQQDAWWRCTAIYTPLVYGWARQAGLQADDAADIVQEVFRSVAAHIDRFYRDKESGSFRGWLWTITRNKIHDHFHHQA
ncbi:MAG: sigma-70 family RNA polymerase sigma factor, partial [Calditrichaeota bacterium]